MPASGFEAAEGVRGENGEQPSPAPEPAAVEFVLRRNVSLSPYALMGVFGSIVALSFAFGVIFAVMGAWMVLPFAGVELLALAAAFLVYGRHATDGEHVRLTGEKVIVEVTSGSMVQVHEFPLHGVRLVADGYEGQSGDKWPVAAGALRLTLVHGSRRLGLGQHLGAQRRAVVEQELRVALSQAARGQQDGLRRLN